MGARECTPLQLERLGQFFPAELGCCDASDAVRGPLQLGKMGRMLRPRQMLYEKSEEPPGMPSKSRICEGQKEETKFQQR